MIRPLEYCQNTSHLHESLETIDNRIAELQQLKTQYMAQVEKLQQANETEFVNLTTSKEDITQLIDATQLTENEQN